VQFGTSGIAEDDFRETCFVISHDSVGLSLDMLLSMDFAVRLTSVGTEGGSRDDSLKIGGTAPETVDAPVETGPTYVANNDSMTVSNLEAFSAEGWPDPLDTFALSVIENDLVDELDYEGAGLSANGQAFTDFVIVDGSNGGQIRFNSDGTVDFSADGDFAYLTGLDTTSTTFTYGIGGGAEATVRVEVFAADEGGGGTDGDFLLI